jgi:hypothetical protein
MASNRSYVASTEFANRIRKAARDSRNTMVVSRSGDRADGYVLLTCDEAVAVADLVMDVVNASTHKGK